MEIDRQRTLHVASFTIVMVTLTAVCAGLVAMIVIATQGAKGTEGVTKNYYYHMAWLSLALLALNVLVLVWMVIHRISGRLGRRSPRQVTEHVDAWAVAGKRFKLEEDPDEQDEPM